MDLTQAIKQKSAQPITHQLMLSLLKDYKCPNDKIHDLLDDGILQSIKKGLYIAGAINGFQKPEQFLLANHILGPSYVSADAALSYYGLIPERVFEVSSMTTKASRTFNTPTGVFSYTKLTLPYYSFGIQQVKLADDQYAMIASPEKALCDKVITTHGLTLRSYKDTQYYLLDNLRLDEDGLRNFDTKIIKAWLPFCHKKSTVQLIVKMIENL